MGPGLRIPENQACSEAPVRGSRSSGVGHDGVAPVQAPVGGLVEERAYDPLTLLGLEGAGREDEPSSGADVARSLVEEASLEGDELTQALRAEAPLRAGAGAQNAGVGAGSIEEDRVERGPWPQASRSVSGRRKGSGFRGDPRQATTQASEAVSGEVEGDDPGA